MTTERASSEEITWEVKQVLDKKVNPVTGNVEYLLQWKNWEGSPTWEPEDNCDCKVLINKFEKELRKRENSSNVSQTPTRQPIPKGRGRSTIKRRTNVLRSSSSSSRSASQPPANRSQSKASSQSQCLALRRSDRVRESSSKTIVDLTLDSSDSDQAHAATAATSSTIPFEETNAIEWFDSNEGPRAKSLSPQEICDSSCSELDEDQIKERKLRLSEILGAQNGERIHLIVKWHGVREPERVPLKVLRTIYCQEILDFLIKKIKWT